MSITSFIRKICVQDAVYWEFQGVDGYSRPKFKEAVPLKVRWDETSEVISGNDGREFVSQAQVIVPDNVVEQSMIMLTHIDDLPLEPVAEEYEEAYEIKKVDRHPLFMSKTFDVFIAHL